jgi:hypothetical protein
MKDARGAGQWVLYHRCANLDVALDWAGRYPALAGGMIDRVREANEPEWDWLGPELL